MSRVINTNSPGKIRSRHRRTIAELLRHMSRKATVDDETKDMVATISLLLLEIDATIKTSIEAWEKKGYWMKADRFLQEWEWTIRFAADIDDVVRSEAWDLLPELMAGLFPHFIDFELKTMTRKPIVWQGGLQKLLASPPPPSPY